MKNYIDVEAERLSTYVVSHSIQKLSEESKKNLFNITRDSNQKIESISYDTVKIDSIKNDITQLIQKEFSDIESGHYDSYLLMQQALSKKKYSHFSTGYMCEVNMNAIRGSTLFGNVGPNIPIKLSFLGYVMVDFKVDIREYGINNVIAELDLIVELSNLVSMPISSRVHKVSIQQPLSIEIIHGEIPDYYINSKKV